MRRIKVLPVLVAALCFACAASLQAQKEHPQEHPKQTNPAAEPISMATLEKGIKDQIAEKAKANGGKFAVQDDVLGKTWRLGLVRTFT